MPVAAEHAGGGPTYFAWAGPTETIFGPEHIRYDEYILKLEIDLEEGKIPLATLDMINPGPAWWFASDRPGWAWIAFDDDGGVTQYFFGRILALPSDLFGQIVTVQFYAKPLDYLARKQAAAEALKVLPFYSKTFIDPNFVDNPDTALQGYSASWHFDPVTHAVTITGYIYGEAGELSFAGSEIIRDSLAFTFGDPPPRAIKVDATVTYTQKAQGTLDTGSHSFSSYSSGVSDGWSKPGTSIGSGWSTRSSSISDGGASDAYVKEFKFEWHNGDKTHNNGDAMSVNETVSMPMVGGQPVGVHALIDLKQAVSVTVGDPETGRAAALSVQESGTYVVPYNVVGARLEIAYDAARDRTEHLMFTLALDSQAMLSDDDGTDDIETLTFTGADVGQPLPGETEPPIGDVSRRSYFPTDRGLEDVAYIVNATRAHLLSKARPAEIEFSPVSFSRALAVTCRHTGRVADSGRLPGGEASGKVVNVKITADGSSGQYLGLVKLKGAIGRGGAAEITEGTPTIADADVLGPDVQLFVGRKLVLASSDCAYSLPVDGVNDDGLVFPLTYDQVVVRNEIVTEGPDAAAVLSRVSGLGGGSLVTSAAALIANASASAQSAQTALSAVKKTYELELKPVADLSFEYSFDLTVGPLKLPAQVDLGGG